MIILLLIIFGAPKHECFGAASVWRPASRPASQGRERQPSVCARSNWEALYKIQLRDVFILWLMCYFFQNLHKYKLDTYLHGIFQCFVEGCTDFWYNCGNWWFGYFATTHQAGIWISPVVKNRSVNSNLSVEEIDSRKFAVAHPRGEGGFRGQPPPPPNLCSS